MPTLDNHPVTSIVKVLLAGDSGGGKTGSLASLVDAGFHLRILDFDDGLRPLAGYVKDKAKLANVSYQTLRDELKLVGGRVGIKKADAFQLAMDALDGKGWGIDLPPVYNWTSRDVLVLDSLGFAGRASLQMVMNANGAALKAPELQHYGTAMENLEKMIAILTGPAVPCHLIVNSHIVTAEGSLRQHVDALGSKLGPKMPRYFDNMITLSLDNTGKRQFKTKKDGLFACKTSAAIADTYPIETGWTDIFKALTGRKDLSPLLDVSK